MLMYPISSILLIVLLMMAMPTAGLGAPAQSGVRLTYSLAQSGATVNEPVFLKVVAENSLGHDVTVDFGQDFYGNFHATLARPDGSTEVAPNPDAVVYQLGFPGEIKLAAHGSSEKLLLLNRWFSFDVPGLYFLALELGGPGASADGSGVEVESKGDIVIDIGIRDETRLTNICSKLVAQILADPTFKAAWDDSEAVEALIGELNRLPDDDKLNVRLALGGIEDRTTDPQIKERIGAALK